LLEINTIRTIISALEKARYFLLSESEKDEMDAVIDNRYLGKRLREENIGDRKRA